MKVGDERSTFVVRIRDFERTLYPDLPGVPYGPGGLFLERSGNFSGPKANFKI